MAHAEATSALDRSRAERLIAVLRGVPNIMSVVGETPRR